MDNYSNIAPFHPSYQPPPKERHPILHRLAQRFRKRIGLSVALGLIAGLGTQVMVDHFGSKPALAPSVPVASIPTDSSVFLSVPVVFRGAQVGVAESDAAVVLMAKDFYEGKRGAVFGADQAINSIVAWQAAQPKVADDTQAICQLAKHEGLNCKVETINSLQVHQGLSEGHLFAVAVETHPTLTASDQLNPAYGATNEAHSVLVTGASNVNQVETNDPAVGQAVYDFGVPSSRNLAYYASFPTGSPQMVELSKGSNR